jgi:hypothetical protein
LPTYLSGVFDGMTAGTATQDQINNVLAYAQALTGLNHGLLLMPEHFQNLAALSYDATKALIGFSGGLESLQTNLGTYYTNFYSPEEQRQQQIKNINAATAGSGFDAAVATEQSFRDLVEAQDLTTESGQRTYAMLIDAAGAFHDLNEELKNAAKEMVGFDAAGLGKMMMDAALNPEVGMSAAQSFSKSLGDSVRESLINATVGNIAASIYNSVIMPIIAGTVVSKAVTDGIIADAKAKMGALALLFNSPEFIDALSLIGETVAAILPSIQSLNGYSDAANDAADAANTLRESWQSITDGIMAEVDRIRGSLQSGPESLAAAQAKFAIALAQTRAGDQVAGQSLPGLSQSLDSIALKEAGSLLDYQRIMGRAANSLAGLGGALTDQYGLKPLTSEADPMVVELRGIRTTLMDGFGIKPTNTQNPVVEELRQSRLVNAELLVVIKEMHAESQSSAISNIQTAKLLGAVTQGGTTLRTKTIA